jgi:hypothetical protein
MTSVTPRGVSGGSRPQPRTEPDAPSNGESILEEKRAAAPDSTAVRVALWRAMHVQVDPPPHVLEDEIGLRLATPDEGWRLRPNMDPQVTSGFRAGTVARARFIEDLVTEQAGHGVAQYVILGAGLDTFAQRRPEIASRLRVFEVDQPGAQAWKRQGLIKLGFGIPEWLRLVPVDFEADPSWWERLAAAGSDASRPAGGFRQPPRCGGRASGMPGKPRPRGSSVSGATPGLMRCGCSARQGETRGTPRGGQHLAGVGSQAPGEGLRDRSTPQALGQVGVGG